MTCSHNHSCGCGSLSNADIKAVIEGLLTTALDEKEFDVIELKNSIHNNLVSLGEVQDKLNDFKADMALNLSALLTKTELASIKLELETLIHQQQDIYEDLQRDFESATSQKLLDYKSDVQDIQQDVASQLNAVQSQLADLVPTRDAYKIAVQNGYVGSEASWLDSLKGHSAYTIAKAHGFRGSESEWLSSLKGDAGPRGPRGERGVTGLTGPKGNPGTDGQKGVDGLTAYELAKLDGFQGTKKEWLAHLEGDSTYDIAVKNGFTGTEEEWIDHAFKDTFITATAKFGGVERELSDKISDIISVKDFLTADDAYAKALLEGFKLYVPTGDYSITATNIDYSVFYGEGFVNGAAVGYSRKPERAQSLNVQELLNGANVFDRYRVTRGGESGTRPAQDFTVDNLTDELFVQHIHGNGSDEAGVITRYNAIRATQTPVRWLKTPDRHIGHQGFNMFRDAKGDRWFVTSAGQATANKGAKCVFFKIADDPNDATGLIVSDFREVVLFDVVSNQHCTTATSLNDRYLLSKLYMPNNEIIIRIHDLQKIVNSTTFDFSNDFINQFSVNADYIAKPLQSITCNNNLVYLFLGSSSIAEDSLPICIVTDMLGVEVYRDTFAPARNQALLDGSGTYYEVEGTGWTYVGDVPKLSVMIMSGNAGGRICRIYQLGARDSSITATVRNQRRKPAFISEAVYDFAVPHDEGLIIGHYDADNDFFYRGIVIDTDQNVSFSSKNSGSLTVTLHDSPTGGNASSTTGSGTFERIGNLVYVNIYIRNISTKGMTSSANLVVRLSATGTNFKLPTSASCLSMSCNNYTPYTETFMTTPTFSGGVLYFRDCIVGGSIDLANVSQFTGATLQISGCYQVP